MRINFPFAVVTTTLLLIACGNIAVPGSKETGEISPEFSAYWFSGTAEISVYDLEQARYGELRSGSAVMVFVTEPFSKKNQVKLDHPENAGNDRLDVMKMNMTRNFETGIYPYSLELSVFNAIERQQYPHAVKAVFTCQEWCGQVFSQYNQKGNHYAVQSYSYFESEGDKSQKLDVTWLEDELWNVARLDKDALPTGNIDIIPGETYTRLMHKERRAEPATADWV
ncbi:MAG: septum formation inhibitor Maf, partial [Flavobacteriales bacterium]|nr:septum formation inhibitor Maf [Flavobacteriales bacterium]